MNLYKANTYYSLLLIVLGIYGFLAYYLQFSEPAFTSLIPLLFGVVLWAMTPALKKDNPLIGRTASTLTLLLLIASAVMLVRLILSPGFLFDRKALIFAIIIIASIYMMAIHMRHFINRRKEKSA